MQPTWRLSPSPVRCCLLVNKLEPVLVGARPAHEGVELVKGGRGLQGFGKGFQGKGKVLGGEPG